jgi:hypothetical protein
VNKLLLNGVLLLSILLCCFSAQAQNTASGGSVSGQVTDASGAVVPKADIVSINRATGTKLSTKSNGAGFYSFPALEVGSYDVQRRMPLNLLRAGYRRRLSDRD